MTFLTKNFFTLIILSLSLSAFASSKVNKQYKGVANLTAGAQKTNNSGHIFHVITHGKGRMWPHKQIVTPAERWKIAYYVHKLQGRLHEAVANNQSDKATPKAEENKTDSTAKTDAKKPKAEEKGH